MLTRSILAAEDEAATAPSHPNILCSLNRGFRTVAAAGRHALKLAACHRPELAMVDILLKDDIDGLDTARALRTSFGVVRAGNPEAWLDVRSRRVDQLAVLSTPYAPVQLEPVLSDALAQG
jgi:CheY-like chemotaxis protein